METIKTINQLIPLVATHPGEILKDELDAIEMSQSDFSLLIGYQKSQVNEIIKGKRNINGELALLLEKVLGIDADFWMEAQKNHELDKARIEAKDQNRLEAIQKWKMVATHIPVKFYKKEGIISGDPVTDIPAIKAIYHVDNLDHIASSAAQHSYARFRKSTALQIDTNNLVGWVKLVQYKAKHEHVAKFVLDKKDELIAKLNEILFFNKNVLAETKESLSRYGIKLIYQQKGEKTPIDGISFWSNENPAIGMSLRHSRLDNFAFTLFHELGHVFEHLTKNKHEEFIDLIDADKEENYKNSPEEQEADHFASNQLINDDAFNDFFNSNTQFSDNLIEAFANAVGVHASIVRGRISFRSKSYAKFSKIDTKIR